MIIASLFLLIAALIFLFLAYRINFLRLPFILFFIIALFLGIYFKPLFPILNFFLPPKDLYGNLVNIDFDLSKNGRYMVQFENKYPGNHEIIILVEHPTPVMEEYNANFQINLIIKGKGVERKKLLKTIKNPFWKASGKSGFSIFSYKVPDDLPLKQLLIAEIEVLKPDKEFTKRYGKQKLSITKVSDE